MSQQVVPRRLTREIRRDLGLPDEGKESFPFAFAALVVGVLALPLLIAGYVKWVVIAAVMGLVVLPLLRHVEQREARARVRMYTHGVEAFGRVLAVEPGGPDGGDRRIVVEVWHEGSRIEMTATGCRIARRGLSPDDDVRLVFLPEEPSRCLVIERARRDVIDAV